MLKICTILSATALIATNASATLASTLGAPAFTITDASISYLNNFELGFPGDTVDIGIIGTITSSVGAPGFVGKAVSFKLRYYESVDRSEDVSMFIDGVNVGFFGWRSNSFSITPPILDAIDNGDGTSTYTYADIYAPFGPKVSDVPEVNLAFVISNFVGERTQIFSIFCEEASPVDCEVSNTEDGSDTGLTNPILDFSTTYTEGRGIGDVTFFTVGGPPIAPVPLPASGLLLVAGLGGLALMRRRIV